MSFLRSLGDSRSLVYGIASTVATAALECVSPRKLTPGKRAWYRLGLGALAAWGMTAELRGDRSHGLSRGAIAGVTIGAAGATIGLSEVAEGWDGKIEDGLAKAGASRPRLVLAVIALVLGAASWASGVILERRQKRMVPLDEFVGERTEDQLVAIPDPLRVALDRILGATDDFGAPELRAQLETARLYVDDPDEDVFPALLDVSDADALAVPHEGTFPIGARFPAPEGEAALRIWVSEGVLQAVTIDGEADVAEWPDPESLTLFRETPRGPEPVA